MRVGFNLRDRWEGAEKRKACGGIEVLTPMYARKICFKDKSSKLASLRDVAGSKITVLGHNEA